MGVSMIRIGIILGFSSWLCTAGANDQFFQRHLSSSLPLIDKEIEKGASTRVIVNSNYQSDNGYEYSLAQINGIIHGTGQGSVLLGQETLSKVNRALGKGKGGSCLPNTGGDQQSVPEKIKNSIRKSRPNLEVEVSSPEEWMSRSPSLSAFDNTVSMNVSYKVVPPKSIIYKANTILGLNHPKLLKMSSQTIDITPTFWERLFGSGADGIKKCLESKDYAIKLDNCSMSGGNGSGKCEGNLLCETVSTTGNMEKVSIANAKCNSCDVGGLIKCFDQQAEAGAKVLAGHPERVGQESGSQGSPSGQKSIGH